MHDFREIGSRLSNWGRWGSDDERGTVNLITPERIKHASTLVKRGAIFDLGIPFDVNGPQPGGRWKDLAILEPVRDYKARHASTMLTFDAVVDCLDQIEKAEAAA